MVVTQTGCAGTPSKSVFQPLKVLQVTVAVDPGSTATPKPKLSGTSGAVRPIWLRVMLAPVRVRGDMATPMSVPAPVMVSPVRVTPVAPNNKTAVPWSLALPKPLPKIVLFVIVPPAPELTPTPPYCTPFCDGSSVGLVRSGGPRVLADTFMVIIPEATRAPFW